MTHIATLITWQDVKEFLPDLLKATRITLLLTFASFACALAGALVLALMRMAPSVVVRIPARAVVEVFRGTPLIFQLFFAYFVMPSIGIRLSPIAAAIIALTLNYSAYMSEVYRAGIQAVDVGQVEAARALGMRPATVMGRIVLPQAVRIVLPPIGNYFVAMFKDTALASVVTVNELLFQGEQAGASTFKIVPIFLMIGAIYFVISFPASVAVQRLDRRLNTRRAPRPTAGGRLATASEPAAGISQDR